MPLKLLKELGIEKKTSEKSSDSDPSSVISELGKLEIDTSTSNCLAIIASDLLSTEALSSLLYSIYNKLNYLFDYLDYRIVIREPNLVINKNTLQEYFSLLCSIPFLWKDKQDLIFFCEQKELLEKFTFQRNIVYFYFSDQLTLTS